MKRLSAVFLALFLLLSSCAAAYAAEMPTFAVVDVTEMDIPALQQAVDDGYLTYEQIMLLYLERIEAYGEMYQCIISLSDTALDEARECDRIYRAEGRSSLLFGLPAIVKDNIDVAGMATTNGERELAYNVAKTDAPVIAELRKAGAIIVAKANMDAWANHSQYSISDYGRVNNAYDLNKSSYGSSGGSAVAAAAALAPICLGTDTNASIRVPSSANGVVGIRPTKGLLSTSGVTALVPDRDTAGCMAKSVFDTALILSAMTGFETDYTAALSTDALSGLRIGVVDNLVRYSTDEIRALFDNAVSVLQQQGAEIVHVSVSLGNTSSEVPAFRKSFVAAMDRNELDLVIYPTIRGAVRTHTAAASGSNSNGMYISPSAGVPAVTVPMGTDSSGLPSGLEFAGRPYDDALALSAAYAFEQALGLKVKTSLAPALYDGAPTAIYDLLVLRSNPVLPACADFNEGYAAVTQTYEAAKAYLSTPYYTDADAGRQAGALRDAYAEAVSAYRTGYQAYLDRLAAEEAHRQMQLHLSAAMGGCVVCLITLGLLRNRKSKKAAV